MKNLPLLILVVLCFGCSKFNMEVTMLPSEITSELPVINITVDEDEFESNLSALLLEIRN